MSTSTKFFNNTLGNTLFDKLKGIAQGMTTFERFLAVVGFFRSSGYFKLRRELGYIFLCEMNYCFKHPIGTM
ncbi:MAG: hypothetical protein IKA75_07890 [Bacteroidaceae bacterium]|nr:hypothetical protein [Bacteroidaceae bacterium]